MWNICMNMQATMIIANLYLSMTPLHYSCEMKPPLAKEPKGCWRHICISNLFYATPYQYFMQHHISITCELCDTVVTVISCQNGGRWWPGTYWHQEVLGHLWPSWWHRPALRISGVLQCNETHWHKIHGCLDGIMLPAYMSKVPW